MAEARAITVAVADPTPLPLHLFSTSLQRKLLRQSSAPRGRQGTRHGHHGEGCSEDAGSGNKWPRCVMYESQLAYLFDLRRCTYIPSHHLHRLISCTHPSHSFPSALFHTLAHTFSRVCQRLRSRDHGHSSRNVCRRDARPTPAGVCSRRRWRRAYA